MPPVEFDDRVNHRTFHQDPMVTSWKRAERMPKRIVVELTAAEWEGLERSCRGRCISAPELVRVVTLRLARVL